MTHLGSNGVDKAQRRESVRSMWAEGKTVAEISEAVGVSKPTIYNWMKADKKPKPVKKEATVTRISTGFLAVMPLKDGKFLIPVPGHLLADVANLLAKKEGE